MDRQPDYEERSRLALELSSNEKAIKEAQDVVFDGLKSSVKFIKDTVNNEAAETATRLKAATEHLKLAGMYVEQVKHSGITVNITGSQADRIEKAVSLMEDSK